MPGPVKQFPDFSVNTNNDTGENTADSIQPIEDGENVVGTVLQRPSESLRQRTEVVRSIEMDSLYLRDADRNLILSGPGKITWPGSTTAAASGIPVISDNLYLIPMLTPGAAQTPPIPPVASAYGTLSLARASDSMDSILVTSQRRSYAAGDQISIDVTAGGSFSCTLDVETVFQRTIHIVATGATQLSTVISALNALAPVVVGDTSLLVTAALEGGALGTDLLLTTQAKQFVSGNYDGEGHTITPANLASFFVSNPTQALAEGDTLCASFAQVSDTSSTGGRRQAIPENSNTTITAGAFFNSRMHPENLVNALPICKVVNGNLVFATGVAVPAGAIAYDLTGVVAADVAYAGGGNWADGTTNPATTVQVQLTKIVADLAGATGTGKIEGSAVGTYLGAATLASQVSTMANFVHDDRPPAEANVVPLRVFRDWQGNARSLVDHMGFRMGSVTEREVHWSMPEVTVPVPLGSGRTASGSFTLDFNNNWTATAAADAVFSLPSIPVGSIITGVGFDINRGTATDVTNLQLTSSQDGSNTLLVSKSITSGAGEVQDDIFDSPSGGSFTPPIFYDGSGTLNILIAANTVASTFSIYNLTVIYIAPPPLAQIAAVTMGLAAPSDLIEVLDPDDHIGQRSLHLSAVAAGGNAGEVAYQEEQLAQISADTAFAMEFPIYTGTITDAANKALFDLGIQSEPHSGPLGSGWVVDFNFTAGSSANWQLLTWFGTSKNFVDTGIAIAANTLYRMRLEVYGVNRNSTGNTRVVAYINGVKVAEFNTLTFGSDFAWSPFFQAQTQVASSAGPYDFRVGRVRMAWNNLAAGDGL